MLDFCDYSIGLMLVSIVFFFKQKTAYDVRISDWSSDVCSSDLSPAESRRVRLCSALRLPYNVRPFAFHIGPEEPCSTDEDTQTPGTVDRRRSDRRYRKSDVQGKKGVSTCRSMWSLYH